MFPQLFRKLSTARTQERIDVSETVRTLIEARIDRLEQNFDSLRLEQKDMLDKVVHLYDRTRKRVKKAEDPPEEVQPSGTPLSPSEQRIAVLQTFSSNGR